MSWNNVSQNKKSHMFRPWDNASLGQHVPCPMHTLVIVSHGRCAHGRRIPDLMSRPQTTSREGLPKLQDLAGAAQLRASGNSNCWYTAHIQHVYSSLGMNLISSNTLAFGLIGKDISVIQGSILGPILFLCYINDFGLLLHSFRYSLPTTLHVSAREKT